MNRTKSGMSTLAAAAAICVAILHCLRASSEGDAAPVMYVDAGTNAVFEFEMPFAPAGSGFVDEWLSGPFEGDGSPLSDTVFRQSAMTGETTNAVFSVTSWIDPATGLPSDMPVEPGDLLSLVRMDTRPLEFSLHGFYEQEGLVPSRTSDALSKASGDSVVSGVADPPRSAPVLAPGLRKEFFRMAEKAYEIPDFSALMPSAENVSLVVDHPVEPWFDDGSDPGSKFACRLTGFVEIPADGSYTFYLTSDDAAALSLDGALLVSDSYPHPARTCDATIFLSEGLHSIEIDFYDNRDIEVLRLEWSGPGISREVVPAEVLSHLPTNEIPDGLQPGLDISFYAFGSRLLSLPDISGLTPAGTGVWDFVDVPNTMSAWPGAPSTLVDRFEADIHGWLLVLSSAEYEFSLSSDDGSRLWIDGSLVVDHDGKHLFRAKKGRVRLSAGLHEIRVGYFDNDGNAGIRLEWAFVGFASERIPARFFCRGTPPDADGDGMPDWWEERCGLDPLDASDAALDFDSDGLSNLAEFHAECDPFNGDTDGDGMGDAWESANGTCPFLADALEDPDGDSLPNIEEMNFGTNPLAADTDGDGCSDFLELHDTRGNPCVADIAWSAPSDVGQRIAGSTFADSTGTWRTDVDGSACAAERAGSLTWNLVVPQGGVDALAVCIGQHNSFATTFSFDLSLFVDGIFVSRQVVEAPVGATEDAYFFLPEVSAGEHEFRLVWRNWEVNTFLAVRDLRFVNFGGPDLDGDGIPDWKNHRADTSSHLDALPLESIVSPLCIEGRDLWRDILEVEVEYPETNAVFATVKTIGDGFYADIPLSTNGVATVSLRDRSLSESFNVAWKPFDVFEEDYATNALVVRTGDALRIAPYESAESEVEISVADGTNGWVCVTNWTESAATPYVFEAEGLYLVTVTHGGLLLGDSAHALVEVVRSRFPLRNPAILFEAEQTLTCPELSPRNVLEHDAELQLCAEAAGDGVTLSLLAHADRDLGLVSRLSDGGAISDAVQATPVWADNGTYYRVVDTYADGSQLVEVSLLLGAIPEGTSVVLEIFVSGVTFEDGTRTKTLTAADFDADGHYTIRFVRARGVTGSVCHRTYIYQNGKLIYTNKDEVQ